MKRLFCTICLCLILPVALRSQTGRLWKEETLSPLIQTLKLERLSTKRSPPILTLNSSEKIFLRFDELTEETKNYEFRIIHCDKDWKQSDLQPQEYVTGFGLESIRNYSNSFNTIQRYVHYWQEIPTGSQKIMLAGNYALIVSEAYHPQNILFVKHFRVIEPMTEVLIQQSPSRDPSTRYQKQEIDVTLRSSQGAYLNDVREIFVHVQQNLRLDNQVVLKHHSSKPSTIEYRWKPENSFAGGNEYRYFDFSSLQARSQFVSNFDFIDGEHHVVLKPEANRQKSAYSQYSDINGRYVVRYSLSSKSDLEADYAWVHFFMPSAPRFDGNFYLLGELTGNKISEKGKMQYDLKNNGYQASLYLKQGYYNYQIVFCRKDEMIGDASIVEGAHYETENEYHVFVYYRKLGSNYDRLIGYNLK